jgi:hypothetical protein
MFFDGIGQFGQFLGFKITARLIRVWNNLADRHEPDFVAFIFLSGAFRLDRFS